MDLHRTQVVLTPQQQKHLDSIKNKVITKDFRLSKEERDSTELVYEAVTGRRLNKGCKDCIPNAFKMIQNYLDRNPEPRPTIKASKKVVKIELKEEEGTGIERIFLTDNPPHGVKGITFRKKEELPEKHLTDVETEEEFVFPTDLDNEEKLKKSIEKDAEKKYSAKAEKKPAVKKTATKPQKTTKPKTTTSSKKTTPRQRRTKK